MKLNFLVFFMFMLLVQIANVNATTSLVQLNVEGNATCSSLATNSILQAKDTSVPANGTDNVAGPDNQTFQYTISGANRISWQVTSPVGSTAKLVNFVILKQAGNAGARAFYFNNPGVLNDNEVTVPAPIAAVSFCYGLYPATSPAALETCPPALASAVCGDSSSPLPRIVTIFDESTPNWNVLTCGCQANTFTECDPALQAGTPGACTRSLNEGGALQFLPVEVQLGRDPDSYYCTVINGTRRCYSR